MLQLYYITTPSAKNVMDALEKCIEITSDCPYRRTFHSDQGWAYQMKAYSHRLKSERIFQSMSRKGNCLDNSVMENFFGLLKQEIYYGVVYYSFDELKFEIERFIKYYNERRIKEKLGWRSPVQYRLHLLAAQKTRRPKPSRKKSNFEGSPQRFYFAIIPLFRYI